MRSSTAVVHRGQDWTLWRRWVLTNAACGAIGPAALKTLEDIYLAGSATRATDGLYIVTIVTGLFFVAGSMVQWLVLRQHLRPLGWWPVVTIIGAITGWLLVTAFVTSSYTYRETFRSNLLIFSFMLAVIGVAQWIVLRRHVQSSGWWVLASAIGGALIWPAYSVVAATTLAGAATARGVGSAAIVAVALQGGVSAAAYAVVTAFALLWLLRGK